MSTPLARAPESSPAESSPAERSSATLRARSCWVLLGTWCVLAAVLVGGQFADLHLVWIDDVGQTACALAGGACCLAAGRRTAGRTRRTWLALTVAGLGWGAGQLFWTVQELLLDHPRPFPSAADLGFLAFPVGAALAMALFPAENTRLRGRDVLDGLILALSLSAVSWSTALGTVVRQGHETALGQTLSVTYPVTDVIVLTMALLAFARSARARGTLAMLAVGIAAMAVSDAVFTYLVAIDAYTSGQPASLGWDAAFVLFGVAALRQPGAAEPAGEPATEGLGARAVVAAAPPATTPPADGLATAALLFVPYLPLAAAGIAAVTRWLSGAAVDAGEVALLLAAVALTLVRQFVTLRENRRLTVEVEARTADLDRRSMRDPLTGLASRPHFIEHVDRALEQHRLRRSPLTMLFCDVNDFKGVNDGLGHAVGDRLLVLVAERLTLALDGAGVLARLGSDEFAVLLTEPAPLPSRTPLPHQLGSPGAAGAPGEAAARQLAEHLQATVATELVVEGTRVCLGLSVGVAHVAGVDETPTTERLLSRADIAMHTAKRAPATGPVLYRQGLALPEAGDWILRPPLEQSLREGAVLPYYQPIIELEPGRLHGFEALARWHRGGEVVEPAVFLPVAQRAGLMPALTAHMLRCASAQLVDWTSRPGLGHLRVAVNVSPEQLVDPQFPDVVRRILDEFDVPMGGLEIEITEEALLGDLDAAVRAAQTLRALGVPICLDDFGVGYSSLAHLHRLPLDKLKLDQSFVKNVETDASLRCVLGGLLAMSRDLGLSVVAEGIECHGQARVLRDLGCPQGQGLLFSAAISAPECGRVLNRIGSAGSGRPWVPLQATA